MKTLSALLLVTSGLASAFADTEIALRVNAGVWSNADINAYTENAKLDERSEALLLASSRNRSEMPAKKKEVLAKSYDASLREWAWNMIFQEEASHLGMQVQERVLVDRVEKELEGILKSYKTGSRAEQIRLLKEDLMKAYYPFAADREGREHQVFTEWKERTTARLKEQIRRQFVASAITNLIEKKYGAPRIRPQAIRDLYADRSGPGRRLFLKPARAHLANIFIAVRPLKEYQEKDPALYQQRLAQVLRIVDDVLSEKSVDQVMKDIEISRQLAARHPLEKLKAFEESNASKYTANDDKKSGLAARLYEIAALQKDGTDTAALLQIVKIGLTGVFAKARERVHNSPAIFSSDSNATKSFHSVLLDLSAEEARKLVVPATSAKLFSAMINLALWESRENAEVASFELANKIAGEFFAQHTDNAPVPKLNSDFESIATAFLAAHPIESGRRDDGWVELGDGNEAVPSKVGYRYERNSGIPMVNIISVVETEREEILPWGDEAVKRAEEHLLEIDQNSKMLKLKKALMQGSDGFDGYSIELKPAGAAMLKGAEAKLFLLQP